MADINDDATWDRETELSFAAKRGDRDAFAILAELYYVPTLRLLLAMSGDPELAADLTQETFLTAQCHLPQLIAAASFAAWLRQIARNLFRMELRRRWVHRILSLDELVGEGWFLPAARSCPDISDACVDEDEFLQAFATLAPLSRQILILHNFRGRPLDEVAAILSISPVAARKRVTRAKVAFDQQMASDGSRANCQRAD